MGMTRAERVFAVILLVLLAAGGGVWLYGAGRQAALARNEPFFVDAPPSSPPALVVQVSGEVQRPGLVRVPAGARVEAAVKAAGGPTPAADLSAVNLAATVSDGERVYVPSRGQEPAAGGSAARPPRTERKQPPKQPISINRASAAEFQKLPGIGPGLAGRIVAYREQLVRTRGRGFDSVEELLNVSGIGPKRFADLQPYVRL